MIVVRDASHPATILRVKGRRMSGAELKERRVALGLSAGELAREFEVLPSTLYRWENDEVPLKGLTALGADLVLKRLEQQKRRGDR